MKFWREKDTGKGTEEGENDIGLSSITVRESTHDKGT